MKETVNHSSYLREVMLSVVAVVGCSLLGMGVGYLMGASQQQREWSMLYGVASIGAISSFFCLIKLTQISRFLARSEVEVKRAAE